MQFNNRDINTESGVTYTLYLIGDQHRVNVNADKKRMSRTVREIEADPYALWLNTGDHHDCIVPADTRRWSSASIDYSIINPMKVDRMADEVVRDGVQFFNTIMDKCVVFHRGNHESYLNKMCSTDVGERICMETGYPDLYSSGMCTTTLKFRDGNKHTAEFVINSAHGGQVPQSDGAGVTMMQKKLQYFKDADLLVRGHSHRTFLQPIASLSRRRGNDDLVDHITWVCHASSYLQTYATGKQCYGEDRDFAPTVLRTPRLKFVQKRDKLIVEGCI